MRPSRPIVVAFQAEKEFRMSSITSRSINASATLFLRRVLWLDAAFSAAGGLVMALGANAFGRVLGLPAPLLMAAGASLLPFTLGVAWLARRETPPRAGVWSVIAINVAWALECLLLPLAGWVEPNALGIAFLSLQALAVALLAELEFIGLRRTRQAPTRAALA
jgi:hypothetical protein